MSIAPTTDPAPGGLVLFHTAHKLTLMAHSPKHYTEPGRLVAKAGTISWEELSATYGRLFMQGLALLVTRRKQVNVLQHLIGYLKQDLLSMFPTGEFFGPPEAALQVSGQMYLR